MQKAYNELLVRTYPFLKDCPKSIDLPFQILSNKRLSDLHSLHDFMMTANVELSWLLEKEETEANRDWADKNLNLRDIEKYFERFMSELETRETQFSSVQVQMTFE